MNIKRPIAAVSAMLMLCSCAVSCSSKSDDGGSSSAAESSGSSSSSASPENTIDMSVSGDNYDSDAYYEVVLSRVENAEVSDEPFSFGAVGELVEPEAADMEAELGSYYISSDGVKLYYDPEQLPTELVLTLKEYFQAFSHSDFTAYSRCIYPSYIEEMNAYLTKDFGYDLKTSFASQCSGLADNTFGDYIVTRVKIDPIEQYDEEGNNNIQSYFELLDDAFGKDYYGEVAAEADAMYYALFYIMAQDAFDEETLLISDYEIVFAEKDGRFYLFG